MGVKLPHRPVKNTSGRCTLEGRKRAILIKVREMKLMWVNRIKAVHCYHVCFLREP